MALETEERRLKLRAFLLEQGLIAETEHDDAERQHQSQLLNLEAAQEDLETAQAHGGQEALDKAELELSTAEEKMCALEEGLDQARIRAPISGVVLAAGRNGAAMAAGAPVKKGDMLVAIGDFSRMAATAMVDEVVVVRIVVGQPVSITGNAFRDLRLEVRVTLDPLEATAEAAAHGYVQHPANRRVPERRGADRASRSGQTAGPLVLGACG